MHHKIIVTSYMRCGSTFLCETFSEYFDHRWLPIDPRLNEASSISINDVRPGIYKSHKPFDTFALADPDWHKFTITRPFIPTFVSLCLWWRSTRYRQGMVLEEHIHNFIKLNESLLNDEFVNKFIATFPWFVEQSYRDWQAFQSPPPGWTSYDYNDVGPRKGLLLALVEDHFGSHLAPIERTHALEKLSRRSMHERYPFNHVNPTPLHILLNSASLRFFDSLEQSSSTDTGCNP